MRTTILFSCGFLFVVAGIWTLPAYIGSQLVFTGLAAFAAAIISAIASDWD